MRWTMLAAGLMMAGLGQAATPTSTATITPVPGGPYKILLYYTSLDSDGLSQSKLSPILSAGGHVVTTIDTGSSPYCPGSDDWSSYDQVWDARIWYNGFSCPVTPQATVDQFDACWQSKATAYLQSCGKLLLISEHGYVYFRNQGIVSLLKSAGAASLSLDACMTASGTDVGTDHGALSTTLAGAPQAWVDGGGGLPVSLITGSPFIVPASANWTFFPALRSVATGWDSSQLPALGQSCVGRLYLHMNTSELWPANFESNPAAKSITEDYFRAVAAWLGNAPCGGCATPTPPLATPEPDSSYVYPSPVHVGPANFAFQMKAPGTARLRILNSAGLRVYESSVPLSAGLQSLSVDTAFYAQGVYYYRIDIAYDSGQNAGLGPKAFSVVR